MEVYAIGTDILGQASGEQRLGVGSGEEKGMHRR